MSRLEFAVTYDIVTPDSAEHGDNDDGGFIVVKTDLRDALGLLYQTRTCKVDGVSEIETDSSPCVRPRNVRVINGMEFETGAVESRTLHIPDDLTTSSARRIARLAGAKV